MTTKIQVVDGTLYKNDKTISEKNREAIAHFKREGGSFTFKADIIDENRVLIFNEL